MIRFREFFCFYIVLVLNAVWAMLTLSPISEDEIMLNHSRFKTLTLALHSFIAEN